jgi:hypothetical protein
LARRCDHQVLCTFKRGVGLMVMIMCSPGATPVTTCSGWGGGCHNHITCVI